MQRFINKMWEWGCEVKPKEIIAKEQQIEKQVKKLLERLHRIKKTRQYKDMIMLESDVYKIYKLIERYDDYIMNGE